MNNSQRFGALLVVLGLAGFALAVVLRFGPVANSPGELPAASLLFILIGMAFYFPQLLEDENKGLSTMRLMTFMVVSLFSVVAMKIGWLARSFEDWKVTETWVYILGLAFGSKLFQSFNENRSKSEGTGAGANDTGTQDAAARTTSAPRNYDRSRDVDSLPITFTFSYSASGNYQRIELQSMGEVLANGRSGSFQGSINPGRVLRVYFKVWGGDYVISYDCEGPAGRHRTGAPAAPISGGTSSSGPDIISIDVQF